MKVLSSMFILRVYFHTDFEEPSLEGSRQQIQMPVSLQEEDYVQQQDPGWPGPPNLMTPHGKAQCASTWPRSTVLLRKVLFLMFIPTSNIY